MCNEFNYHKQALEIYISDTFSVTAKVFFIFSFFFGGGEGVAGEGVICFQIVIFQNVLDDTLLNISWIVLAICT